MLFYHYITYIYLTIHKLFIIYYIPTYLKIPTYKTLKKNKTFLTIHVEFFITHNPKSVKMGKQIFIYFF